MSPMPASHDMGTISFDYLPDSPLSHLWELATKNTRFEASASKDRVGALTIKAEDAIDCAVEKYQRVCNRVRFSAKLADRSYVYVRVQFRAPGRARDWGWIACDTGVAEPRRESRDEWVISRIPEKDGWTQFDLFLPEVVQRTYGQVEVLQFRELLGFRLRGELSITPISLFRDESEINPASGDHILDASAPRSENGASKSEGAEVSSKSDDNKWTRTDKWTAAGVVVAILAILIGSFNPEVRRFLHLDRPLDSPSSDASNRSAPQAKIREPLQVVTAGDIAELRRLDQVVRIREAESGKTLSEIPPGSFGFTLDVAIVDRDTSLHSEINVNFSGLPNEFEIHRLHDGSALLVVYVGPETLDRLREGAQTDAKVSLYTSSWDEAPTVIAIPLNLISCARYRELTVQEAGKYKYVSALDCQQK
jgi:hypothetical protein